MVYCLYYDKLFCPDHQDSSGFTLVLLGLVLGAAGIHPPLVKRKEILARLKATASDTMKDLGNNPKLAGKIEELQKTMDQALATINSAAEKVAEATEGVKSTPKKNFFQKMGASLGK
jgi:hypothetical protein